LTGEFPEKSWTKHGVNKLLKKLRGAEPPNDTTQQWAFQSHTHFIKENNYAFVCLNISNIL